MCGEELGKGARRRYSGGREGERLSEESGAQARRVEAARASEAVDARVLRQVLGTRPVRVASGPPPSKRARSRDHVIRQLMRSFERVSYNKGGGGAEPAQARYVRLLRPPSSSSPRSRYSRSIRLSIWILIALGSGGNLFRLDERTACEEGSSQ